MNKKKDSIKYIKHKCYVKMEILILNIIKEGVWLIFSLFFFLSDLEYSQ
jgi:hypothetical protein